MLFDLSMQMNNRTFGRHVWLDWLYFIANGGDIQKLYFISSHSPSSKSLLALGMCTSFLSLFLSGIFYDLYSSAIFRCWQPISWSCYFSTKCLDILQVSHFLLIHFGIFLFYLNGSVLPILKAMSLSNVSSVGLLCRDVVYVHFTKFELAQKW